MIKTRTPTTIRTTPRIIQAQDHQNPTIPIIPTRKPSIKLCRVTPDVDEIKIMQALTTIDKNDEGDMSIVSSSLNEGYFSSSSEDSESIRQEVHDGVNESILDIKQLKIQKERKGKERKEEEEEEISRIIAKIQGEHISSLPESQQIKNKTYPEIKQEHDCIFEVAYSTIASSGTQNHQELKQCDNDYEEK